jgi:Dolichyl-phosphate-mannose-protein mannosyltransferase
VIVAIAAFLLCLATGFLLVCLGWAADDPIADHLAWKFSLTPGYGLGVFSCSFFVWRVLGLPVRSLMAIDLGGFALLLTALLWRRRPNPRPCPVFRSACDSAPGWSGPLSCWAFAGAVVVSLYACARRLLSHPNGVGWDAIAIWNLHARFLFRGGQHWRDGFTVALPWSHPDYPLLLPASIAHVWEFMGKDSTCVPAAVALFFTFSTVGLLVSSVSAVRGKTQAFLAGTALLGTPYFLECGTSQYADVPLGFFLLAMLALLWLHDTTTEHTVGWLGLAGMAGGFAAWTKNEGLLFLAAVAVARGLTMVSPGTWKTVLRRLVPFSIGLVPVLLVVGYFKLRVAGPSDLWSAPTEVAARLLAPRRYWKIFWWFARSTLVFGRWTLIPEPVLGFAYALLMGKTKDPLLQTSIRPAAVTLALTAAGYFFIYLITPYDLSWHLRFSLGRLFVQLWPSILFLFFMVVRTPGEAADRPAIL